MPKKPKLTWKHHKKKWIGCVNCHLCEQRDRVVLARGKLPCDVLFVGEAPGGSEDVLGSPFVGPAGKTLDSFIEEAEDELNLKPQERLRKAWTNLIGCIPKDEDGRKVTEPPKESIEACAPRLVELATLANARALVMVGNLSQKWCPKILQDFDYEYSIDIIHPAAILRMDPSQQTVAAQRTTVELRDLFNELLTLF